MLFVHAVPGCETRNLQFFLAHGYAASADTVPALAAAACGFLRSPELTQPMIRRLAEDFSYCAAEELCRYLLSQAPGQEH